MYAGTSSKAILQEGVSTKYTWTNMCGLSAGDPVPEGRFHILLIMCVEGRSGVLHAQSTDVNTDVI